MIFHPVFAGSNSGELDFTFDGSMTAVTTDEEGNWEFSIVESGNLIFNKAPGMIDVFLVGGGGAGVNNGYGCGGGGGGGFTKTIQYTPERKETYPILIGDGALPTDARGGTTSAFGSTAEGGYTSDGSNGGAGGSGGGGSGGYGGSNDANHPYINRWGGKGGSNGSNGDPGGWEVYGGSTDDYGDDAGAGGAGQRTPTRAFGESSGQLYSGGGGGNAAKATHASGAAGGAGGGGSAGNAGAANTGGGGGGGGNTVGNAGGSGIVIIRNHREATA